MTRVLGALGLGAAHAVSESGVLVDARAYYRAFFHAARQAKRYIAITGWQLDSDVELLRGEDAAQADGLPVRLLPFLNALCERNPELHVYVLAWDFSVIYALEREWLQKLVFSWNTHSRIHFHFDTVHALGASHHQKLVVVDGGLAFAGGMDLAASRWDDRAHAQEEPRRLEDGKPHGPYHDVQTFVRGEAAAALARLFSERWCSAVGCDFSLPAPLPVTTPVAATHVLPAGQVTLSQTRGRTLEPPREPLTEIRALYLSAIRSARELIYLENQYFTSRAVHDALTERMRDPRAGKLEVVLVLPREPEALKEQVALGVAQAKLLRSLAATARQTGHRFGVYWSCAGRDGEREVGTYVHSKLLLVDDRLLSVGSANTTNRSLALDTELNVSWERAGPWPWPLLGGGLGAALRRLRLGLLAEHAGLSPREAAALPRGRGLVAALDALASAGTHRLRHHAMETVFDRAPLLSVLEPNEPLFDPEKPVEEEVYEALAAGQESLFTRGLQLLSRLLTPQPRRLSGSGGEK